jgi:hypothetical protein
MHNRAFREVEVYEIACDVCLFKIELPTSAVRGQIDYCPNGCASSCRKPRRARHDGVNRGFPNSRRPHRARQRVLWCRQAKTTSSKHWGVMT